VKEVISRDEGVKMYGMLRWLIKWHDRNIRRTPEFAFFG
jgi:hypothetical protein